MFRLGGARATRRRSRRLASAVVAGVLLLGPAVPAHGAYPQWPATRYRSLTQPDICLAADTVRAFTRLCNGGRAQLWHYTHGSTNLMLINDATTMCLEWTSYYVFMNYCADAKPTQRWNAKGVNGHLYFQAYGTDQCLVRTATTDEVVPTTCPPPTNVPNAFALDYYI
jgi:hypothetical protein